MSATAWFVIAIVSFSLAGLALIADVFVFVFLKIHSVIGDLSGKTVAKEVKAIRASNASPVFSSESGKHRSAIDYYKNKEIGVPEKDNNQKPVNPKPVEKKNQFNTPAKIDKTAVFVENEPEINKGNQSLEKSNDFEDKSKISTYVPTAVLKDTEAEEVVEPTSVLENVEDVNETPSEPTSVLEENQLRQEAGTEVLEENELQHETGTEVLDENELRHEAGTEVLDESDLDNKSSVTGTTVLEEDDFSGFASLAEGSEEQKANKVNFKVTKHNEITHINDN